MVGANDQQRVRVWCRSEATNHALYTLLAAFISLAYMGLASLIVLVEQEQ